jgi:hypothetical protein
LRRRDAWNENDEALKQPVLGGWDGLVDMMCTVLLLACTQRLLLRFCAMYTSFVFTHNVRADVVKVG